MSKRRCEEKLDSGIDLSEDGGQIPCQGNFTCVQQFITNNCLNQTNGCTKMDTALKTLIRPIMRGEQLPCNDAESTLNTSYTLEPSSESFSDSTQAAMGLFMAQPNQQQDSSWDFQQIARDGDQKFPLNTFQIAKTSQLPSNLGQSSAAEPLSFLTSFEHIREKENDLPSNQTELPFQTRIRQNIEVLEGMMNPSRFIDVLSAEHLISERSYQCYDSHSTGSLNLSNRLLHRMMCLNLSEYELLLSALNKHNESDLHEALTGTGEIELPAHWRILREKRHVLHKNLDRIPEILDDLLAKDVFRQSEVDTVNSRKDKRKKINEIIKVLRENTYGKFVSFIAVLKQTRQHHIAGQLSDDINSNVK